MQEETESRSEGKKPRTLEEDTTADAAAASFEMQINVDTPHNNNNNNNLASSAPPLPSPPTGITGVVLGVEYVVVFCIVVLSFFG